MTSWIEIESVIGLVGIYAILAMSLNMICGLTGLLQLGQAGFFAVGAYTAGLISIYSTFPSLGWVNLLIGTAAAMIMAGAFSIVIGLPCLRLRGDYLAIATLGFGIIIRLLLVNIQFPGGRMFPGEEIGGATGISFTEYPAQLWPDHPFYSALYSKWWVIWIFVLVTFIILMNVKKSSFGRAMMCIREDEIAAQSMGINLAKYKMTAFLLSASFAGMAGALFFHRELMVAPNNFTFMMSIEILLMVVLGGLGSLTGSLMAAVLLGVMPLFLSHLYLAEYRQLIYAVLLIVLIRIAPDGIFGMGEIPPFFLYFSRKKEGRVQ